ncbi:D-glycero-beta-D-manno-heptose 1-phosphate adenylyltransferase [Paracrocinitomix mangrovi]|uniref:D-glycero-beta-D-manno-heptose 1-phosphate adenylyltransferase n=1 Tax=Paracrocinitomix mangrovi TaxID=2862509 RepID=UPI001C8E0C22|nr:D-glycero-beta-D-manno-heptose 1-phosphate adenylyltransferase [Paracrocinitomix mangrovi]UKN03408.1 D-glycero-beta-D-manno-heptose 1-phosphate adenylyltransferase [Paracrocinitomix mangrovi]
MQWLNQIHNKIITSDQLSKTVSQFRDSGKKIVFTNGCFDILHKGHVTYLAKAAELGDVLIVGINSDASVQRQGKGEDRPVNKFDGRSVVLAALGFVEAVIEFDDDTPIALIEEIKPDVLVKGADYDPAETDPQNKKYIVGREVVIDNGGVVKVIDLVEGFSTTNIINKLQK